jgi:hypothetical protein
MEAPATVVSAYYKLSKSKHSSDQYKKWIANFLKNVRSPIIMFCEEESVPFLSSFQDPTRSSLVIIVLPFSGLPLQTEDWMTYWRETMEREDEFKHLHSPEQFIIWNSKTALVRKAIEVNPFHSDKFVWCDAGCWRDESQAKRFGPTWPNPRMIPPSSMLFLDINDLYAYRKMVREGKLEWWQINTRNAKDFSMCGSIFAGSKDAWIQWNDVYYNTLIIYKESGWFAGDDQSVMMSAEFQTTNSIHIRAPPHDAMVDRWFYLQFFLSEWADY